MPSYLHQALGSACWNCERDADDTVAVTLRMPTGDAATFALCGACLDGISPALAAAAGQIGIRIDRNPTVFGDAR